MADFHDVADLKRIATVISACQDTFQGMGQVLDVLRSAITCSAVGVWRFDDVVSHLDFVASAPKEAVFPQRVVHSDSLFNSFLYPVQPIGGSGEPPVGELDAVFADAGFSVARMMPLV